MSTEVDDLEWPYPLCSGCGEDAEGDGSGWWCHACGLQWDQRGCSGERMPA